MGERIMLEFMNRDEFAQYCLSARIGDCEPNLLAFNYITPMAVCIETMVKSAWLEFKTDAIVEDAEEMNMGKLLADAQYKSFRKWLNEQYDINEELIGSVHTTIHKESNKFKHHLSRIPKRNSSEKKTRFECFYRFTSKYYKQKTGEDAPPWSDDGFDMLMKQDEDEIIRRANRLMMRG